MFCTKCGSKLKENAKFCMKCGTPVKVRTESKPQGQGKSQTKVNIENKDDEKEDNLKKKGIVIFLGVLIGILIIGIIITSIILIKRKADEPAYGGDDTSIVTESETDSETNGADTEEASTEAQTNEMETHGETEPPTEEIVLGDYTNNTEKINTYKIVISDNSWIEAYNEALEYENGYLVHINSQDEFDYIVNQIAAEGHENIIFWLGGMRTGNSESYSWVDAMGSSTGPELNSQNFWMNDEPSFYDYDLDIDERYMNMFFHKSSAQWVVNDAPNNLVSIIPSYSGKVGYIIEIEN